MLRTGRGQDQLVVRGRKGDVLTTVDCGPDGEDVADRHHRRVVHRRVEDMREAPNILVDIESMALINVVCAISSAKVHHNDRARLTNNHRIHRNPHANRNINENAPQAFFSRSGDARDRRNRV